MVQFGYMDESMKAFVQRCADAAEKALKKVLSWEKQRIPARVKKLEERIYGLGAADFAVGKDGVIPGDILIEKGALDTFPRDTRSPFTDAVHEGMLTKVAHNNGDQTYTAEFKYAATSMPAYERVDVSIRCMSEVTEILKRYGVAEVKFDYKEYVTAK